MSLFAELKRRNVFRVGIAYALTGWVLLQAGDFALDLIGAPNWVIQSLFVIVLMGLPIALVFAWAFELTPEGIKREHEVDRSQSITPQTGKKLNTAILILMAVAIAYLLADKFFLGEPGAVRPTETAQSVDTTVGEPAAEAEARSEGAISRQSIAVLPFTNRSDNEADVFFVEGVHDDLLTNLARISALKVISRTSVLRYKDTERPIPEIAKELGVATVMEGAVQRSGNTVRINVQLIDAATDEHLWAEIFDRELTAENLFAIQSEISQKIAGALEATLTDAEQSRIARMPTDNLEAYDAYVRGRQLMATRNSARLKEATEAFERAVELDPEFALAWVGVADSYDLFQNYGVFDWNEALEIRERAVNRALELDPQLGEAHTSLGQLLNDKDQYEESEAAYRKSIELSPGYATAYHWYALMIARYSLRTQEQADLLRKAAELDPRSSIIGVALAGAYFSQGRYSLAERQLLNVLEREPGFQNAIASLAGLYFSMGRLDQAMRYRRKAEELDPGNPGNLQAMAFIYLHVGETEKAEELLARLEEMDSERIGNGFVNLWINMNRNNMAGAREAANWIVPRMEKVDGGFYFMSMLQANEGDYQSALDNYVKSDPRWADPEQWNDLIGEYEGLACSYAWLLLATGDEEAGQRLLADATHYLTEELPAATEHADQFGAEVCHLAAGDDEAALAVLRTHLDHDHPRFWHAQSLMPWYGSVRFEERYQAMVEEYDRKMAEQRELVSKLDEALAL